MTEKLKGCPICKGKAEKMGSGLVRCSTHSCILSLSHNMLHFKAWQAIPRASTDAVALAKEMAKLVSVGAPVQDSGDCEKCAGLRASVDDSMCTVRRAQDELSRAAQHISMLRGEFNVERQRHENIEGNLFYETRLLREQIVGYGGDPKINVAIGTTSDPVEHLMEQRDRALLLIEKLTVSNDAYKETVRLALNSLKKEQDGSLKQLDWSKS